MPSGGDVKCAISLIFKMRNKDDFAYLLYFILRTLVNFCHMILSCDILSHDHLIDAAFN